MKALVLVAALAADAHAEVACSVGQGWSFASGTMLPVHPRIGYFRSRGSRHRATPPTLSATLDGKPVKTVVTWSVAEPFGLTTIEIDSDRTGTLDLAWSDGDHVVYAIAPATLPTEAKATMRRFRRDHPGDSFSHEEGLEVTVDAPAIAFTARWRRDAQTTWETVELVANQRTARLGRLGCASNFSIPMLEQGIDLELTALLADGKRVKVVVLPAHVVLK